MDNKSDKLDLKTRTLGDGMDSSLISFSDFVSKNLKLNPSLSNSSMKPVIPTGRIIRTIPKYVPNEKKMQASIFKKPKEPKFIPYEPFKGAVNPIIPRKIVKIKYLEATKNNVDIHDLVQQMSDMRTTEMNKLQTEAFVRDEMVIPVKRWEDERLAYETDIKNLRETNAHLENQLKFQGQVNTELKTLLVAAVGEDLESRVQHLTEDKLQLARALLNSANHLTSHQEQTEWLSGQCEVWRSKFLASSLMVEELARWKSALSNRINELQENMKVLIDERTKVRNHSLQLYSILDQINDTLVANKDTTTKMRSANIIDLTVNNHKLADCIAQELLREIKFDEELLKLPTNTPGENVAVKILKNPVSLMGKRDVICDALRDAAMAVTNGQMYLQHPNQHATCCKHCKGDVHQI